MAARRHLPIVGSPAPAPAPAPAGGASVADEPPPWHWVPIGTVVSVVAFALLAQGAAAVSVRVLSTVYRPGSTAAEVAAARAAHPSARLVEISAAMVPLLALLASVALGGWVIGRFGVRTNARHGTLSGLCTALLFWAVTGWRPTLLLVTPFAMAAGWAAAKWGLHRRAKSDAATRA